MGCFNTEMANTSYDGYKTVDGCATFSNGQQFGMEYPSGANMEGEAQCVSPEHLPAISTMERRPDTECGQRLGGHNRLALYSNEGTLPRGGEGGGMAFVTLK